MGVVTVGVDVGQRRDPTAIAVVEQEERRGTETHHIARHLERLPLGTPYPAVAERVAVVIRDVHTPGSMPEKDQPGFDQVLRALRDGLNEDPRLKEMPAEEVARQLALGGHLEGEPPTPWSRRLSKVWRPRSRVCRTRSFPPRKPTPREQW